MQIRIEPAALGRCERQGLERLATSRPQRPSGWKERRVIIRRQRADDADGLHLRRRQGTRA